MLSGFQRHDPLSQASGLTVILGVGFLQIRPQSTGEHVCSLATEDRKANPNRSGLARSRWRERDEVGGGEARSGGALSVILVALYRVSCGHRKGTPPKAYWDHLGLYTCKGSRHPALAAGPPGARYCARRCPRTADPTLPSRWWARASVPQRERL